MTSLELIIILMLATGIILLQLGVLVIMVFAFMNYLNCHKIRKEKT